jgi:hypothetical protein
MGNAWELYIIYWKALSCNTFKEQGQGKYVI